MSFVRMHEDQVDVEPDVLRRLLRSQHPQWADLPIERVPSSGTDNTIYRLGDELVVRLPLIDWAVRQVELEHEWLPRLAALLPVAVHEPVAIGEPGEGYPWPWSVYRWIDGANPDHDAVDADALARDLADVVLALRSLPTDDVPRSVRGFPLRVGEERIRSAIHQVRHELDAEVLEAAWDDALAAPAWDGGWVPVHGDLSGGNLVLGDDGRLRAVIDFSCFGLADPANDVDVAFELFTGASRDAYRAALDVDDATWRRARGWAIKAVYGIPYYERTNPGIVARARRRLRNVIDDWRAEQG